MGYFKKIKYFDQEARSMYIRARANLIRQTPITGFPE